MRKGILLGATLALTALSQAEAQRPRVRPEMTMAGIERRKLTQDREEIERYFSRYGNQLPPGLEKREDLPPGLEKHLVRGGELPSGLEQEIQPLPRELEVRLTALEATWRRGFLAGKVITWDRKTQRVVDIIILH